MSEYVRTSDLQKALAQEYGEESPIVTAWLPYFLEKIPTADVAPVIHSHWNKTCVNDVYQCDHCKKAVKMDMFCNNEVLREYCPKCGAKMDEEVENNVQ